jgi:hypothetical protein
MILLLTTEKFPSELITPAVTAAAKRRTWASPPPNPSTDAPKPYNPPTLCIVSVQKRSNFAVANDLAEVKDTDIELDTITERKLIRHKSVPF